MKLYTVYMAENKVDGKKYIGFDSAWPKRQRAHLKPNGKCPKFHNAIQKYGPDAFEWTVLFQGWDKEFALSFVEPLLIAEHNTRDEGYNVAPGGQSSHCKAHPSHIENGRKTLIHNKMAGGWNKGLKMKKPAWNKGLAMSEETKAKKSLAMTGKKMNFSEDALERMSQKGKTWKHKVKRQKRVTS